MNGPKLELFMVEVEMWDRADARPGYLISPFFSGHFYCRGVGTSGRRFRNAFLLFLTF